MKRIRFFHAIGMAGVGYGETQHAKIWARRFDVALIPVAVFALLAWYDNKRGQTLMSIGMHIYADWMLWAFFVAELLVISWMVKARWIYWRYNWFNLLMIIAAMPALWHEQELGMLRAVRFILVIVKLANLSSTIRALLSRNHLGITILSIGIFVFCAGVMMAAIDPGIHSIGDGIWWAWATVTTVGYGDVVPVSGGGRVLAGIVMLVGLGLFSLITANFAAFFVAREEQKIIQREEQLLEKEQQVIEQETKVLVGEDKIIRHLQMIEARIKALEEKIPRGKE
jgi:voltage-gated potassium channel